VSSRWRLSRNSSVWLERFVGDRFQLADPGAVWSWRRVSDQVVTPGLLAGRVTGGGDPFLQGLAGELGNGLALAGGDGGGALTQGSGDPPSLGANPRDV